MALFTIKNENNSSSEFHYDRNSDSRKERIDLLKQEDSLFFIKQSKKDNNNKLDILFKIIELKILGTENLEEKKFLRTILTSLAVCKNSDSYFLNKKRYLPLTGKEKNYLQEQLNILKDITKIDIEKRIMDMQNIRSVKKGFQDNKNLNKTEIKFYKNLCNALSQNFSNLTHTDEELAKRLETDFKNSELQLQLHTMQKKNLLTTMFPSNKIDMDKVKNNIEKIRSAITEDKQEESEEIVIKPNNNF